MSKADTAYSLLIFTVYEYLEVWDVLFLYTLSLTNYNTSYPMSI